MRKRNFIYPPDTQPPVTGDEEAPVDERRHLLGSRLLYPRHHRRLGGSRPWRAPTPWGFQGDTPLPSQADRLPSAVHGRPLRPDLFRTPHPWAVPPEGPHPPIWGKLVSSLALSRVTIRRGFLRIALRNRQLCLIEFLVSFHRVLLRFVLLPRISCCNRMPS